MGSKASRQSTGSYTSRQSTGGLNRPTRRGYVRPQGTNFAASAQSRESVMSLGSIAHLQYYFARTGLLDGKGGRLAKKKDPVAETQLPTLDTDFLSPAVADQDSSYASSRSSLDVTTAADGMIVESPVAEDFEDYYTFDEEHPEMLPPTVSTYKERPKHIPPPPTLSELKSDLQSALNEASKVLAEAKGPLYANPHRRRSENDSRPETPKSSTLIDVPGWHEIQGVHILDILTLAIRAARKYYTAHDQPTRLSAIKSERQIRAELLSVMDVLKRMATRNFAQGMKDDECETMETWIESVWDMLSQEEALEGLERKERLSWTWLDDAAWPTSPTTPYIAREEAFLHSMDRNLTPLPPYTPSDLTVDPPNVSPFLEALRSGLRLVQLHNAMVKCSRRPFGAISAFHIDTRKPYRCADNLRFWIKAAELRWDVRLEVDVMGVVNGIDAAAWEGFEAAIWKWCATVRSEISAELKNM